eukprot:10380121-Alexandrium_andersonii.AAC.1
MRLRPERRKGPGFWQKGAPFGRVGGTVRPEVRAHSKSGHKQIESRDYRHKRPKHEMPVQNW